MNRSTTPSELHPWVLTGDRVLAAASASREGLTDAEARRRRHRWGPNRLREPEPRAWAAILVAQLRSVLVLLLAGAAAAAFVFGRAVEGAAVVAVIVLNTLIGFVMELRATRSMEALRRLGQVTATVRRDGALRRVPAVDLVVGDILHVEGGDVVTCDVRLLEANKLQADESLLTGESLPVSKHADPLDQDVPLAERANMLFKGTTVTRGSAVGVVVATGMRTELGHISELVFATREETTPIEHRLAELGRRLVVLTALIAVLVVAAGLWSGRDWLLVLETAIALAVSTVPEGLPIVATLALARGMWKMVGENAVVQRLAAVETLGSTNILLTDKTGTLTENRLTVTELALPSGAVTVSGGALSATGDFIRDGAALARAEPELSRLLTLGALCNNADLPPAEGGELRPVGEPMEVALLVAAAKAGIVARDLLARTPEVREEAFDPDTKMMATVHAADGRFRVAVKGAPEAVLPCCVSEGSAEAGKPLDAAKRARWLADNEALARRGLRVLAVAEKVVAGADEPAYSGLTLVGLVAMHDPPREEVRDVVAACRDAGLRLVMVTGDQPATALRVAEQVGLDARRVCTAGAALDALPDAARRERLVSAELVARATPRHKLELIEVHQLEGDVVAMLGDGVNDAPALRRADIGVAMGRRGTEVARQAADMVLSDDRLATLVIAIREGRAIFDNIRKFAVYLLSCNVSELLVVGVAALVGLPLPILPLQILFLNLVTDVFPALALAACRPEPGVMQRPPRPAGERVLERAHWWAIGSHGTLITAAVLASLVLAVAVLQLPERRAVTVSFTTLGLAQLWHVFDMRRAGSPALKNEVTTNPWVWGACALTTLLVGAAAYHPALSRVLDTEPLDAPSLALAVGMSLLPAGILQAKLSLARSGAGGPS